MRKIALSAVQGNNRAQKQFADLVERSERQATASAERLFEAVMQYKVAWKGELATRTAKVLTGPAPFPHPDELVVDLKTGMVTVIGPLTPDQKAVMVNGGPGHQTVPSPEWPLTLSGSRAEMVLLKNLPQEQ